MKRVRRTLWFSGLFFAFSNSALAYTPSPWWWNLDAPELLSTQDEKDVSVVSHVIKETNPALCSNESLIPFQDIQKMLLIRYMYAGRQVWLLYKTSEKAVIARLDVDDGYTLRYGHHGYAEITDEAWERLFRTFSDYQQRPPTRELRKGQRVDGPWPRGYSGTVNLYENGKLRSYLLVTEDVKDIHFPNPIGDVVCATLLAGMHCKPGAKTEAGWVEKLLSDQIRHNHSSKHAATLNLCSAAMPCGCDGKKVEDYLADGDINGFTRDGRTCINVAKDGNKPEVVQKLKALGAREDVDNYWKPIKKNACSVHQETQ